MSELTRVQGIELFHLAFLQVLQARLGPERYALKGGANLRYFFGSVRYSEDIDFDMIDVKAWRLAEHVEDVLRAPPITLVLRTSGLAVAAATPHKQTETVRRWKVALRAPGQSEPLRTKIEFSNRNGEKRYLLEPVPERIVNPYAMRAPKVQHYTLDPATEQKVEALADRKQTQARDVFDLDLLLHREPLKAGAVDPAITEEAMERTVELPFDAFADQVLPFLEADARELYGTPEAWEEMKLFVIEKLGEGL